MISGRNAQGEVGHSQLVSSCRYSSGGVQGRPGYQRSVRGIQWYSYPRVMVSSGWLGLMRLYGFRAGQGTGTASLKSKHLTEMREEVLYEVFIDLWKAYYALYREHCIEILVAYGIGLRTDKIIRYYWDNLYMVERARQYYSSFPSSTGVSPRGISSPPPYSTWWWTH